MFKLPGPFGRLATRAFPERSSADRQSDNEPRAEVQEILRQYLVCSTDGEALLLRDTLICTYADPIVQSVIARKSRDQAEREDIYSLAMTDLVGWLDRLKQKIPSVEVREASCVPSFTQSCCVEPTKPTPAGFPCACNSITLNFPLGIVLMAL